MITKNFFDNSLLFFFVIGIFLALNIFTPLVGDDYVYSLLGKDGGHTQSIFDILNFCKSYYLDWGGRIIAHLFVAFWLFVGKPLFNIANTAVYIFFILLLQFHSAGSIKKIKIFTFFFLVAGFISAYSLVTIPPMADRAYFSMVVFLFITALNLLIQIKESISVPLLVKRLFWGSVCIIFCSIFYLCLRRYSYS